MNDNLPDHKYASSIQAGKLKILEHFWKYSSDNIFILVRDENGDFIIEDFNPAQRLNFFVTDDIKGKKLNNLVDEITLAKIYERYNRCIAENKPYSYDESHDFNGQIRHWNTMLIPVIDSEDGKVRIFGIAREMTLLINAKEALATINESLEKAISERTLELQQSNEKLKEQSRKLEKQANIDPLTQIGNRRYFFKSARSMVNASMSRKSAISLIYIDLDDFKQINDTYGHAIGDAILTEFADRINQQIRNTDIFARFGGEEFVILIPDIDIDTLTDKAQKILKSINAEPFAVYGLSIHITASIGVTACMTDDSLCFTLDNLIRDADKALYTAKKEGKNRVVVHQY